MSDSGRTVEELLATSKQTKYNLGFPSKSGPTPETLKNYLDVSVACVYSLNQKVDWSTLACSTFCPGLLIFLTVC